MWRQWIMNGSVFRRSWSERPRNTNEQQDQKSGHFAPTSSHRFIYHRYRHKSLPWTPHYKQCRLDLSITRERRLTGVVKSSAINRDSVSMLMSNAHASGIFFFRETFVDYIRCNSAGGRFVETHTITSSRPSRRCLCVQVA